MSSSLIAVRDVSRMSSPGPRSRGPTSRRSFTSAHQLDHLAAYEVALENGQGGAYLREHGLSSMVAGDQSAMGIQTRMVDGPRLAHLW